MKKKQILYGKEAREKMLSGITKLSRAVTTTLGPKGRNVALDVDWGTPKVLHDGVSVSRDIELEDPFENMGAKLVKESASRTNDATGDGTTTAILLSEKITSLGMKSITAGMNPMILKKGMDRAVSLVIDQIKKLSKTVKQADWEKVATISAQNEEIGKKVAEALELVGESGLIEVEEGSGMDITIDHKEGMEFDKGFLSPHFTTNEEKTEAVFEEAYILFTSLKVDMSSLYELVPIIDEIQKTGRGLVLVADDINSEVVATLIGNKLRRGARVLPVKAPLFGDRRKEILEDMAVLTGGILFGKESGRDLKTAKVEDLGRADSVKSTKDSTRIVGGRGPKVDKDNRLRVLKGFLKEIDSEHDKERLKARIARLTGGVAIIKVGASSESEMINLKERVIDARGATQSAIESGIVPGGAIILMEAVRVLGELVATSPDEQSGIDIIAMVAEEPLKLLASNSGEDGDEIVGKVREKNTPGYGYNAMTGEFGDMTEMGIIEPAKISIEALRNANSVASMVLTTECLVTESEDD